MTLGSRLTDNLHISKGHSFIKREALIDREICLRQVKKLEIALKKEPKFPMEEAVGQKQLIPALGELVGGYLVPCLESEKEGGMEKKEREKKLRLFDQLSFIK